MTARFGNALVALGALVLSWVERQENHALAVATGGARGVRGTVLRDLVSGVEPADPRGGDAVAGVAGGDGFERADGFGGSGVRYVRGSDTALPEA